MVRISNSLIGILNSVTLLSSIAILGGGIWLANKSNTVCLKFLEKPIIFIGIFLLLVSLAGLIGACGRVTWLLWVYLFVMFALIVLLFVFTIFAFVVTNKGAGQAISNIGFKEYRLGDYSNWLQKRMNNPKNWVKIMSCLQSSNVCRTMEGNLNQNQTEFYSQNLSPIQSGCCKPPTSCGFTYVSPTNWTAGTNSSTDNGADCNAWSNDPATLCYKCDSCKAGVVADVKGAWKKVAVVNVVFLIFLIIVYSVGCCAFRNSRRDNSYPCKGYA